MGMGAVEEVEEAEDHHCPMVDDVLDAFPGRAPVVGAFLPVGWKAEVEGIVGPGVESYLHLKNCCLEVYWYSHHLCFASGVDWD